MDPVNTYLTKNREYLKNWQRPARAIRCKDGTAFSIQASESHYSLPRRTNAFPYTHFEVGFVDPVEPLLLPYAEDPEEPTETVFNYVPLDIVLQILENHGGMVED